MESRALEPATETVQYQQQVRMPVEPPVEQPDIQQSQSLPTLDRGWSKNRLTAAAPADSGLVCNVAEHQCLPRPPIPDLPILRPSSIWPIWRSRVITYLTYYDLWKYVEPPQTSGNTDRRSSDVESSKRVKRRVDLSNSRIGPPWKPKRSSRLRISTIAEVEYTQDGASSDHSESAVAETATVKLTETSDEDDKVDERLQRANARLCQLLKDVGAAKRRAEQLKREIDKQNKIRTTAILFAAIDDEVVSRLVSDEDWLLPEPFTSEQGKCPHRISRDLEDEANQNIEDEADQDTSAGDMDPRKLWLALVKVMTRRRCLECENGVEPFARRYKHNHKDGSPSELPSPAQSPRLSAGRLPAVGSSNEETSGRRASTARSELDPSSGRLSDAERGLEAVGSAASSVASEHYPNLAALEAACALNPPQPSYFTQTGENRVLRGQQKDLSHHKLHEQTRGPSANSSRSRLPLNTMIPPPSAQGAKRKRETSEEAIAESGEDELADLENKEGRGTSGAGKDKANQPEEEQPPSKRRRVAQHVSQAQRRAELHATLNIPPPSSPGIDPAL